MNTSISLTKQWQIHIPKDIREKTGIYQPQIVDIKAEDGKIIISLRKDSVVNDAGKYAKYGRKKINLDNIRDQIDYSRS